MKHGEFQRLKKLVRKSRDAKEIASIVLTGDFNEEQDDEIFNAIPPEKLSEVLALIR